MRIQDLNGKVREMIIRICDICKQSLGKETRKYIIKRSLIPEKGNYGTEDIDICQDCLDGMVEMINKKKEFMNKPEYSCKTCNECYYISPIGECENTLSDRMHMSSVYDMKACDRFSEDI